MVGAASDRLSLGRRLFIFARLSAAWLMWANMAVIIGMMKAQAGLPTNTPEWNKTWEDYRRWALNPPRTILTPTAKINLEYGVPAGVAVFLAIPIRMLTNKFWLIVFLGVVVWGVATWLTITGHRKVKGSGDLCSIGLRASLLVNTCMFVMYYIVLVFVPGAVVGH